MNDEIRFVLNDELVETSCSAGSTVLDFIRLHKHLTGTKEGCREGECGACSILLGDPVDDGMTYKAVASCLLPLGELHGKHAVTVEGVNLPKISHNSAAPLPLNPVQQALTDEGASQCGFCTPGFVIALTGFLLTSKDLSFEDAQDAMDGNICRCTGYLPIQRAAQRLSETFGPKLSRKRNRVQLLVEWSILPEYFNGISERLKSTARQSIRQKPDNGSVLVAGGTDLYVQKPQVLENSHLEFMSHRDDLKGISEIQGRIVMGATVTTEELRQSALINNLFPGMKEYLNLVSSTIMRNRATAAGNIVNASPIGDLSIMLLALDAQLLLAKYASHGLSVTRTLPLKKFFIDYKKYDLNADEIIHSISFPLPSPNSRFHFEKVSQRKYLDIASCNSAIQLEEENGLIKELRLSAGGVAPVPFFLERTSAFFKGKKIDHETVRAGIDVMKQEIKPISDVRGSAAYKTLLLANLIKAHFIYLGYFEHEHEHEIEHEIEMPGEKS